MTTMNINVGDKVIYKGSKYLVKRILNNDFIVIGDSGVRSIRVKIKSLTPFVEETKTEQTPTIDITFLVKIHETPLPVISRDNVLLGTRFLLDGVVKETYVYDYFSDVKFNKNELLAAIGGLVDDLNVFKDTSKIFYNDLSLLVKSRFNNNNLDMFSNVILNLYPKDVLINVGILKEVLCRYTNAELLNNNYSVASLINMFKFVYPLNTTPKQNQVNTTIPSNSFSMLLIGLLNSSKFLKAR